MTVDQIREKVTHAYAGPTWRLKVQEMEDRQVIAIYKHMIEDGILERQKKPKKNDGEQLTIYDLLKEDKEKSNE